MGKGGEKTKELTAKQQLDEDEELLLDRRVKMEKSPGFHWDNRPEPHAIR